MDEFALALGMRQHMLKKLDLVFSRAPHHQLVPQLCWNLFLVAKARLGPGDEGIIAVVSRAP